MLSRKRSRDRSPEKNNYQPAITANVIDVNCQSKIFVESSISSTLASNVVTGNDITQREDHVIYSREMIEEKSSFHSNGTGIAKLVLPHLVPAVVSAAKFAGRDRYTPLEKTESCDKAIISVFGVSR